MSTNDIKVIRVPEINIVYNHGTRLFPFSPRIVIDRNLVEKLKRSISETGFWQPIVVRAESMEGIAGNHRFLAYLELAKEKGLNMAEITVLAMVVDCDEGTAVAIALIENEGREDLTDFERVHTMIKAAERKPKLVENIFEVDGYIAEQLRFWEKEFEEATESNKRRKSMRSQLTRKWVMLINDRLADYSELRTHFFEQLKYPTWVQARTLEEFEEEITQALLSRGIRFEQGKTWNDVPTAKCLNSRIGFDELNMQLQGGESEFNSKSDGTIPDSCPYLRLFPRYIKQFIPAAHGDITLRVNGIESFDHYPPETIISEMQAVRGNNNPLLDRIDAFCVAPNVLDSDSCFRQQEMATAKLAVETLQEQGLSADLPDIIKERKGAGEFIWLKPQLEGQFCEPKTCLHAHDNSPGYVMVIHPGGKQQMCCVHQQCGEQAKLTLADWEAEQQKIEQRRFQAALGDLRQRTVEQTLLSTDESVGITSSLIFSVLEQLLVPEWDTVTMGHVVIGWQRARRAH